MLQPNQIADRLDDLALKAAALNAAILGMTRDDLHHEDITYGVAGLAWEIRDALRNLSDEVCPGSEAQIKAVAS